MRTRNWRGVVVCTMVLALGATTASAVANEPTVTEFTTGLTLNAGPFGIVEGPGDKLWFSENSLSGLGAIAADTNAITELSSLALAGDVRGIAKGPDGNLWVTETASSGKIARVTPAGVVTEWAADAAPSFPVDITAGPDGNLWYVSQSPEFVGRITPDGTVTTFSSGLTPNSDLSSITAGPDGNLWFTESANPGRIGRITTAGVITEYSAGLSPNMAPTDITAGPDGKLWFTENADPGGIGRISTEGAITEFSDGLTDNRGPRSIAAGSDDALWFTESGAPGAIGRITTGGTISEHSLGLTAGSSPWAITPGPDGNMWFTGNTDPGLVARITVPPGLKTQPPQHVDETTAILRAKIRPNAQDTSYHFEYGRTEALGKQTGSASAGNGWDTDHYDLAIDGLERAATYYYRAVATNSAGTTVGELRSLKTKSRAAKTFTKDKQPEFARSVVAAAQAGTIRFHPPGGRWRRLPISGAEIPLGATVDARRGGIELTSARRGGTEQTGRFGGGIFSIHQPRLARGRVDVRLRGGDFSRCRRPARASAAYNGRTAPRAHASYFRRERVRRVWGSDSGGRYRTYGRHSQATVRGTRWATIDRCDGTLTRVTRGAVVVRDFVRRRNVLVRAGHSYLARKRTRAARSRQ